MTGYPSIDKPWLKYYDKDVEKVKAKEESMFQMLERCNEDNLNTVALDLRTSRDDFKHGIKITYKEYLDKIKETAKALLSFNIKENEIVPLVLPNIPESRILIYALNIIGATSYPINFMLPSKTLQNIIYENNVKNLVIFSLFNDKYLECYKGLDNVLYLNGLESLSYPIRKFVLAKDRILGENQFITPNFSNIVTWDEFYKERKKVKENLTPYFNSEHIATIIGTSGTTGTPKGVCLSDKSINSIALQQLVGGNFDKREINLDALIQSIGYGFSTMHYSGCGGLTNILISELITDKFPHVLCKIKPDHFNGGPIHYENLKKSMEFKEKKINFVRNLVSGGATLNKETEKELNQVSEGYVENAESTTILVRQGFGITENGGCGTYAKKGSYKFGGVGIPLPLENISIFKPNTDIELPYNTEGEICISGPTIMSEYLNNREETEKVLKRHKDGLIWLHTGDLGKMDEDGHLFITNRIKQIFMRKGFNVHPQKIADFINSLSLVEDSVVIGVEHPEEQMVPVAFVVLKDKTIDENVARDILNEQAYKNLEETSNPYEWYFLEEFPRNLGGKVDEQKLIKEFNINYNVKEKVKVKK